MERLGRAFKNFVSSLKRSVQAKELVGLDANGNKYYRWEGVLDGRVVERRQVKVAGGDHLYDPRNLPTEWRMWLQKTRKDPPSEEELAKSRASAEALRRRVAALDQAEQLRRMRQQSLQQQGQSAAGGPDLARFVQQVGGGQVPGAAGSSTGQQAAGGQQSSQGAPAAGGSSSEGTGAGETFRPGTWTPGSNR